MGIVVLTNGSETVCLRNSLLRKEHDMSVQIISFVQNTVFHIRVITRTVF